jgi:type IV pilus assembly protein PilW
MRLLTHAPSRGFSMVELLVAMLIGLIGMVIIFQVFEVSEGIKRSTTSGGDAQQNGVIALYTMERDLRNAGMGFNETAFAGCNIVGYDKSRATPDFPPVGQTLKLAPVLITAGATPTTPDQITVLYGSQNQAVASVPIQADMNLATDPVKVTNPFGYSNGDILILNEPASGKNCAIMEATDVDTPSVTVKHEDATPYNAAGKARNPRFNKPGGLGIVYKGFTTANVTRVFNMGNLYYVSPGATAPVNLPVFNTYAVANGNLTVTSQFVIDPNTGQPQTTSVADNIVHMRALYGLDDGINDGVTVTYNVGAAKAGDGIVDRYVDAATFDALVPVPWQSLIAVRIVVVARSVQAEDSNQGKGAACDATAALPQWTGTPWAAALKYRTELDVSATVAVPDSWQCYRYRVFETTIPLRNWIWKAS